MKTTVSLESKDIREIIARFLGIGVDQVIPGRYSYSVTGMAAADIATHIYGDNCEEDDRK